MKRAALIRILLAPVLLLLILVFANGLSQNIEQGFAAQDIATEGWFIRDGQRYYYEGQGRLHTGELIDSGARYYFDGEGVMLTGWQLRDGQTYYYASGGAMVYGEQQIDGGRYYFNENGSMFTGWQQTEHGTYYYNSDGQIHFGELVLAENTYYFDDQEGMLLTGWVHKNDQTFYYDQTGRLLSGEQELDGFKYLFDTETAAMKTGWICRDGVNYYYNEEGHQVFGRQIIADEVCYFDDTSGGYIGHFDPSRPMVALTYDDGPAAATSRILDILEQHHARATFFVVGNRVSYYPSTIKRAFDLGCEMASHTYQHCYLIDLNPEQMASQLAQTSEAVAAITGQRTALLRPPGGKYNDTVKAAVGMPIIMWNIDTRDWETKDAQKTADAVLNHVKDGDIILMHDLYDATADASAILIPALIERGYQLVTVSELSGYRGGIQNGAVYYQMPPLSPIPVGN